MATTKTISVKVSTAKVVKALETALAEQRKQIADYEKATEAHEKAVADWEKAVTDYVKAGKAKITEVGMTGGNWRLPDNTPKTARVEFALPVNLAYPESPRQPYTDWQVKEAIDELENAIALLKMTDEEFVSTNTYKGVARYIK
jgi:hypothetical protein